MEKYLSQFTLLSNAKAKPAKIRKYDNIYLDLGFIKKGNGRPKCVVCLRVLANEASQPKVASHHKATRVLSA